MAVDVLEKLRTVFLAMNICGPFGARVRYNRVDLACDELN